MVEKQIKISVVTIFLNAEQFIQEAIESVLAQSYQNWELVLVDDGSTDASTSIAKKYAAQFSDRIRYVDHTGHQNRGMSASRNLGIKSAKGEYLAFLDADDVFLPEKLQRQVGILDRNPKAAMVYGPTLYWHGWTGDPKDIKRDKIAELGVAFNRIFQPPELMTVYLEKSGYAIPCICGVMVRKNILEQVGGFEEDFKSLYEDQVFFAKIVLNFPVYVEAECGDKYRQHSASCCSQSMQTAEKNFESSLLNKSGLAYSKWLLNYISQQKISAENIKVLLNNKLASYQDPLVSIIIPVFNGAQFIPKAIKSVLDQTFKNVEIIVVDDGSTDNTKVILEPWIKEARIRYVYQENKGLAGARNAGIRLAQGQYLKFLDCDDFLYPRQLELQVHHLKNKPDNLISVTDYELEFETGTKKTCVLNFRNNQLAQFIEGNPCPVHTILASRSIIIKMGGFDETLLSLEDSDLWLQILIDGGSFEKVDYIGCCYCIIKGSLSDKNEGYFVQECKFYEKLNRRLMPQFDHLPHDTLYQLLLTNTKLIHKCMVRKMRVNELLPALLGANKRIYKIQMKGFNKHLWQVLGSEKIALLKFLQVFLKDKDYPKKLVTTSWRSEANYV